jgi:hypothetical protein
MTLEKLAAVGDGLVDHGQHHLAIGVGKAEN